MCNFGGNARRLCGVKECDECKSRSFAVSPHVNLWLDDANELKPYQVFLSSGVKFNFYCKDCKHYFRKAPHKMKNKKIGCSYCIYPSSKLCNDENCAHCKNRSFASSDKVKYWSKQNKLNPRQVSKYSHNKYYFDCDICKHTFLMALNGVGKGNWCSYCNISILCDNEKCKICEAKSFVSHPKSKYLSLKNNISTRMINLHSGISCLFDCECGHEFESVINDITGKGQWCPYCSFSVQKLCKDRKCVSCHNRSFASHPKSIYFCKENGVDPRDIALNSSFKYLFQCGECNNKFSASLNNVNAGKWCPFCLNKTERIILDFLKLNNIEFEHQYSPDWAVNQDTNKKFKYDFYLPKFKISLELDGIQHFEQVSNWNSPEITRRRDLIKMILAYNQGITTVRILQEDVYYNRRDWQKDLARFIGHYSSHGIVMVCSNNEYSQHYLDFVSVTNQPQIIAIFK